MAVLSGYKTYIVAGLAILGAIAGVLDGDIGLQAALQIIVPAVLSMTVRHGISTSK